jgi:vancomycin resistance protein YoaR
MLFRNALINPLLYVKKRYNHAQRYVNFYSSTIFGDDASVYKRIKTLKIKNISSYPIYFRKKQIGNKIYLVSIVPKKVDKFTSIEKKQI